MKFLVAFVIGLGTTASLFPAFPVPNHGVRHYHITPQSSIAAVVPDGKTIILRNRTGSIRELDLESGKQSPVFWNLHNVSRVQFFPDGQTFVALGSETRVRTRTDSKPSFVLNVPMSTRPLKLNPDGTPVLGEHMGELVGPGRAIPVASPDGRFVYAHNERRNILKWDVLKNWDVRSFTGTGDTIEELHLSPDGKCLLVITAKEIVAYDTNTEKQLSKTALPKAGLKPICYLDPTTLFCFADDAGNGDSQQRWFRRWDLTTGQFRGLHTCPQAVAWPRGYASSLDQKHVFVADRKRVIHVIDTGTGKEVGTYRTPMPVHDLVILPDGKHLLAGDQDRTLLKIPVEAILRSKVLSYAELITPPRP